MRASAEGTRARTAILILLLTVAGGFLFRTVFAGSVMPPPERMQGETTQAYRYALAVSEGRGIPSTDSLVMRPAGMRTAENSIFEEYIAGGIHRLTGGDFDTFIRFFSRFFPLLVMPVLFTWMYLSGYSVREALIAAAIYAVFLPALLRTRGESLYRETVALPLILTSLMFADLASLNRRKLLRGIAGAVFLFLALAAWKVTGFISLGIFTWMLFTGRERETAVPFALSQILASLILSHMRHDGAITSPATVMAFFTLLNSFLNIPWMKWAAALAALVSALAFGSSSTGHVTGVILAKFRFFFSHPGDPSRLSEDARLFWVSGYTSPSPGQILFLFLPVIPAVAMGWGKLRERAGNALLFWILPVSIAGYLLFDRLHVLLAAAVIPVTVSAMRGRKWLLAAAVCLLGLHSMTAPELAGLLTRSGLQIGGSSSLLADDELDDLLTWSSAHPGTVLSFWHISGLLSAYAGTPVVTHTFFENADNRRTIVEFARMMFSSEEEMASFMEEHGARYLVYQADFIYDRSPQGLSYLAGLTEIPDGSLAIRLHYYPETLQRLVPVWQGPSLRVFELDGEQVPLPRQVLWERRYGSFINDGDRAWAALFDPVETGLFLANSGISSGSTERLSAALLLFAGSPDQVPADAAIEMLQRLLTAYLSGDYDISSLADDFETYLHAWGPDPQLRLDLIRLLRNAGLNDRAEYHEQVLENMGRQGL